MTNINQPNTAPKSAPPALFNKCILTTAEAAVFLGISTRKLKALRVPRHRLDRQSEFYMLDDLQKWVRTLPMQGEFPTAPDSLDIRICD